MKKWSITWKVTIWYTILMTLLVILSLVVLFSISSVQMQSGVRTNLQSVVSESFETLESDDGYIEIEDDLDYFKRGVYLSVFDGKGHFIYGKMPGEFLSALEFKADEIQTISENGTDWYVYDAYLMLEDNTPVWIRGITSQTEAQTASASWLRISMLLLPLLVVLIAIGGYYITKRAFLPVRRIRQTVEAISEGSDLSKRIGLGAGQDEIHQLGGTFDRMLDRLQESFERERQFTSDASHELRTPTAVIMAHADHGLNSMENPEEVKECLEHIKKQSRKMTGLISQLLMLTRADKGNQKLHLEIVNMSELLEAAVEEHRELAMPKDISIHSDIEHNIIARVDETLILRMFVNLLSNAVSYGRQSGHIQVALSRKNSDIVGYVKDDGIGIAAENIDKIWNRFYQEDDARSAKEDSGDSSGLGLSMVKWIVEAHGGSISVQSEKGKGSTFQFRLPGNEQKNILK